MFVQEHTNTNMDAIVREVSMKEAKSAGREALLNSSEKLLEPLRFLNETMTGYSLKQLLEVQAELCKTMDLCAKLVRSKVDNNKP
jgi:hypothetical protein